MFLINITKIKKIFSILAIIIFMSLSVWGALQKAQDNPETIEEAIERIVQEHDDDANAHLDTGQSLKSHKASEIIDHLALSIVEDKIEDGSITPVKIDSDISYITQKLKTSDQTISGDFEWADVSQLSFSFNSSKVGRLLVTAMMYARISGNDAGICYRIKVTNTAGSTYFPHTYGIKAPFTGYADSNYDSYFPFSAVVDLIADDYVVQVQAAREAPDETMVIQGGTSYDLSLMIIQTVGTVITPD